MSKHFASPRTELAPKKDIYYIQAVCSINRTHRNRSSKARIPVRWIFPQIGKDVFSLPYHKIRVLDSLYEPLEDLWTTTYEMMAMYTCPMLARGFEKQRKEGKIPAFSPQLPLFFSTPGVADGKWVQFNGGIWNVTKKDPLTIASFCPRLNSDGTLYTHHLDSTNGYYEIFVRWNNIHDDNDAKLDTVRNVGDVISDVQPQADEEGPNDEEDQPMKI